MDVTTKYGKGVDKLKSTNSDCEVWVRVANANAICMGHSTPGGAVSSITGRVPSPVLQPKRASCCAPSLQIFGCVSLGCTDIFMIFFA